MSNRLPNRPLGEVCRIIGGGTPSKKNPSFYGGDIPWATVRDMNKDVLTKTEHSITDKAVSCSSTNVIPAHNVVIASRVGLGKVCFIDQDTAINQDLRAVIPLDDRLLSKYYLFWWFKSIAPRIVAAGKGATVQGVTLPFLRTLQVPVLPLPEQKRIVAILDEAFEGIATATVNAEKNLANARELFESYLNSVFAEKGEGWVKRRLGDVFNVGSSKRIYKTDWASSGVPFYGGREIVKLAKFGTVVSNVYISEEKYVDYSSKYEMPQKGDILVTARGTIGVGYVVQEGDKFYYKDGNIILLNMKIPTNPYFILYAFKSRQITDQFSDLTGATVTHLSIEKAKELRVNFPDFAVQNSVVENLGNIEIETQRLEAIYQQKLNDLAELKQSILQKAFSGELTHQAA